MTWWYSLRDVKTALCAHEMEITVARGLLRLYYGGPLLPGHSAEQTKQPFILFIKFCRLLYSIILNVKMRAICGFLPFNPARKIICRKQGVLWFFSDTSYDYRILTLKLATGNSPSWVQLTKLNTYTRASFFPRHFSFTIYKLYYCLTSFLENVLTCFQRFKPQVTLIYPVL